MSEYRKNKKTDISVQKSHQGNGGDREPDYCTWNGKEKKKQKLCVEESAEDKLGERSCSEEAGSSQFPGGRNRG